MWLTKECSITPTVYYIQFISDKLKKKKKKSLLKLFFFFLNCECLINKSRKTPVFCPGYGSRFSCSVGTPQIQGGMNQVIHNLQLTPTASHVLGLFVPGRSLDWGARRWAVVLQAAWNCFVSPCSFPPHRTDATVRTVAAQEPRHHHPALLCMEEGWSPQVSPQKTQHCSGNF